MKCRNPKGFQLLLQSQSLRKTGKRGWEGNKRKEKCNSNMLCCYSSAALQTNSNVWRLKTVSFQHSAGQRLKGWELARSYFIPKARNGNCIFIFFFNDDSCIKHFAVNHFDSYKLTSSSTSFVKHFVCYIMGISDQKFQNSWLKCMTDHAVFSNYHQLFWNTS